MFRVENLLKRYGDLIAVDRISFEVRRGEIYGLLGPNGAGKTTTMSVLSGLLRPDDGSVHFDGIDLLAEPIRVKQCLGVVPQETALYETLTARENLRFWGGLYGLSGAALGAAVDRVLEQVGLTARAGDRVRTYSGGMKRRLNLALGIVHGPKAVLMDEPTVGIDPQGRANILDTVRAVAAAGTTVLYTTHYLEEAETLCDRIGIMDHGKILAEGTVADLKARAGQEEIVTIRGSFSAETARDRLGTIPGARLIHSAESNVVLGVQGSGQGAAQLLSDLFGSGLPVDAISIQPPSLNSLFLNLTGRELRD